MGFPLRMVLGKRVLAFERCPEGYELRRERAFDPNRLFGEGVLEFKGKGVEAEAAKSGLLDH